MTTTLSISVVSACAPRAELRRDLMAHAEYAELAGGALDTRMLLGQPTLVHEGWHRGDAPLWSRLPVASLELPLATLEERELRLTARRHASFRGDLEVAVSLNEQALGSLRVTVDDEETRLALPARHQLVGGNALRFEVTEWREHVQDPDSRRRRWVAFSDLQVRASERSGQSSSPAFSESGLWLPGGTSASFYFHEAAESMAVVARAVAEAELEISVQGDGSERQLLLAERLGARETLRRSVPLIASGFLRLVVESRGRGLWVESLTLGGAEPEKAIGSEAGPTRSRPNIVLFVVDALRADSLGIYGQPADTSPRIDRFAGEAIRFDDAWAQSSWTRPAVASIFTGLQPDTHGVDGVNAVLVPELVTLAEVLRPAGYRTGAFVANHVVSDRFGFAQGFDAWDGSLYGERSEAVVEKALEWIGEGSVQPFFVYVHTLDPHGPYAPDARHWQPFLPKEYDGRRDTKVLARDNGLRPDELAYLRSAYHGEVHDVDAAFGRLLDGLAGAGLTKTSLVAFTADHGEEFRDHGGGGHGHTLYQEVIRIPLLVRLPGGSHGGTASPVSVQQIDLFPTLAGFAGTSVPAAGESRDLSDWLMRVDAARPSTPRLMSRLRFSGYNKTSLRDGSMKLIVNNDRFGRDVVRLELYDLAVDPAERRNVARQRPIAARYLRNELLQLQARHETQGAWLKSGATLELTDEERARLRALGYLGEGGVP